MEITKDTDLSEILSSDSVTDIATSAENNILNIVDSREGALQTEISSGRLDGTIEGQEILKNSANSIKTLYTNLSSSTVDNFNQIIVASVNKEIEELGELRSCVSNEVNRLDNYISGLETNLNNCMAWGYPDNQITEDRAVIDEQKKLRENYQTKLSQIDTRIEKLNGADYSYLDTSSSESNSSDIKNYKYSNEIPSFELDENGVPTTIPADFTVDAHHRIDVPGWGICYEATGDNSLEVHYNPDTNLFYWDNTGVDWSTYDYASSDSIITPSDMLKSEIKGGVCPF
jgi:hypothetical protein